MIVLTGFISDCLSNSKRYAANILIGVMLFIFLCINADAESPEVRINELESHVADLESRLKALDERYNQELLEERWTKEMQSLIDDVLRDSQDASLRMIRRSMRAIKAGNFSCDRVTGITACI